MRKHQVLLATIVLFPMCCSHVAAAIITGPSPYLSVLDTPAGVFTPGAPVILQDFEDADGPWRRPANICEFPSRRRHPNAVKHRCQSSRNAPLPRDHLADLCAASYLKD